MLTLSKDAFADHTLAENQDRITDAVWITRAGSSGIYNFASEDVFTSSSPADTEWAWALSGFNVGQEIAAANFENLTFNTWQRGSWWAASDGRHSRCPALDQR